jgi:hypothetical protein
MDYKPFIVLALLLPATAWADDAHYPTRRAGLWEGAAKVGATSIQSKSCIDLATDRKMMDFGNQKLQENGGTLSVNVEGNVVHVSTVAQMGDRTMSIDQTITFHGDSQVTSVGHTMIEPPLPQMPASMSTESTTEQHWVGPCPADMKPGDIVTNGKKININDTLSK